VAIGLLHRLASAADAGGRIGTLIEILVLQALARRAAGDQSAALESLSRAVKLAEPARFVRVFADEGEPMAALLKALVRHEPRLGYARRLATVTSGAIAPVASAQATLIEPLSDRELDVLRLLATDLDGPDIARQLHVSLNTMRTHSRSIFRKLQVTNRRAAVRQAHELNLLPGARKA
jgi:LuxR family maltose regulon positive regulatory protein